MSLQVIRCRPRAPPMFCGMPPSHAGSLARDCERSDPVVGDFSISGTVLVAFARLFHRHSLQTREQEAPRCRPQEVCLRTTFSQRSVTTFSRRSVKRGYLQQCVGRKSGENTMLRLFTVAGFALAVATSAQAMSPAPLTQPDGMITQVRLGCGPGRTRVEGVCVARTTIRHTRRAVRRGYRRGY